MFEGFAETLLEKLSALEDLEQIVLYILDTEFIFNYSCFCVVVLFLFFFPYRDAL